MIDCGKCGAANKEGSHFCTSCGSVIAATVSAAQICQTCASPLSPGAKFCKKCGQAITAASTVVEATGASQIQAAAAFAAADSEMPAPPALPEAVAPLPVLMQPPPLPVAEPLSHTEPVLISEPMVIQPPAIPSMPSHVVDGGYTIDANIPAIAEAPTPVVNPGSEAGLEPGLTPASQQVTAADVPFVTVGTQAPVMDTAAQAEPAGQISAATSTPAAVSPTLPPTTLPSAITKPTPIQQGDIAKPPVNLVVVAAAACVVVVALASGVYWAMNKHGADDATTAQKQDGAASGTLATSTPSASPADTERAAASMPQNVPENVSANTSPQAAPTADINQSIAETANNANPVPTSSAAPGHVAMAAPVKKAKRKTDDEEDDEDENWDNERRITARNSQNGQMNPHLPSGVGIPANGAMPSRTNALLSRADDYIARRQYDKAIAIVESALQLDPGNPAALAKLRKARQLEAA